MKTEKTLRRFAAGQEEWNRWARALLGELSNASTNQFIDAKAEANFREMWSARAFADFRDHVFENDADLSGYIFPGEVDFTGAVFKGAATFSGAEFHSSLRLDQTVCLVELNLEDVVVKGLVSFGGAKVKGPVTLKGATFEQPLNLVSCEFERKLDLVECEHVHPSISASLSKFWGGINLRGFDLTGRKFTTCKMPGSDFSGCTLAGAKFNDCDLANSNFAGAKVNTSTDFELSNVEEVEIDSFTLECMKDYGSLTKGDRMKMHVRDDVATLRRSYSGYRLWLHLGATVIFVFPYLWFILQRWGEASFNEGEHFEGISLLLALMRYIYNGGVAWEVGRQFSWTFLVFLYTFAYNVVRIWLLWKTTDLEFNQKVSGLPQIFSLYDKVSLNIAGIKRVELPFAWDVLLKFSNLGLGLLFLSACYNGFHFLSMEVPLPVAPAR